jgi:hypothetical protein
MVSRGNFPGSCKEKSCRVKVVSICRELQYREAGTGGTYGKRLKSVRGMYVSLGEMSRGEMR